MGKKKFKSRNEFRYNNSSHHPNYVFGESEKNFHSLGLTHSDTTFGKKNMPLKNNPKKNSTESAYIRNGIITDKKQNYSRRPITNMSFSTSDFKNVKSKIRNYKKEHKRKSK